MGNGVELGQRLIGLAGGDKAGRGEETITRRLSLLRLPVPPTLPAANAQDDEKANANHKAAVAGPKFLELFLADFLVHLTKHRFVAQSRGLLTSAQRSGGA